MVDKNARMINGCQLLYFMVGFDAQLSSLEGYGAKKQSTREKQSSSDENNDDRFEEKRITNEARTVD